MTGLLLLFACDPCRYHMLKRIKRGTDMRRFKQVQQNLMADSAAAVADMMGGEQQEEQENHELSGGFFANMP